MLVLVKPDFCRTQRHTNTNTPTKKASSSGILSELSKMKYETDDFFIRSLLHVARLFLGLGKALARAPNIIRPQNVGIDSCLISSLTLVVLLHCFM